jgi:hypothetical protein
MRRADNGKSKKDLEFFLHRLSEVKAIQTSPLFHTNFQMAGPGHPHGTLLEHHVMTISEWLWGKAVEDKIHFDGLVGLTSTAEYLVESFRLQAKIGRMDRQLPILRFGYREGEIAGLVENAGLPRRRTVLLITPSVEFGTRCFRAIRELRECGFIVRDVLAFLDEEEGAAKKLADNEVKLRTVTTKSEVLDLFRQAGFIPS